MLKPKQIDKRTNHTRKPTLTFKNRSYVCVYHCAQLSYTTQLRTVSDDFPSYSTDNKVMQVTGTIFKDKNALSVTQPTVSEH